MQNRRCVAVARGRGASLPCIPTRSGKVLLLRGWAFLLRVGRVGSLMTSWMLLVYGIGGARLSREGGERRAPASPQGVARFFCCAVGRFLEGRAQCSDGAFGTSGVPLVCRIGGVGHCAKAGSDAPLHPHEGRRGSFAARLGVSIEGSAQRSDGAFGTSRALLICRIGGVWPSREGGEHRAPASPQEAARFFRCAVERFY